MCTRIRSLRDTLIALAVLGIAGLALTQTAGADGFIPFVHIDPQTGEVRVRAPFVRVDTGPGGTRVWAPFTRVDTGPGGTRVWAPFTRVDTGPRGTRVRAPFTRYQSHRYVFPYGNVDASPPRPPAGDVVRIEIDSSVRVVVPAGRLPSAPDERIGIPPVPRLGNEAPLTPSLGEPAPFPTKPGSATDEKETPPKQTPPPKKEHASKPTTPKPTAPQPEPSYLVIPLRESDRAPRVRVTILRRTPPVPSTGPTAEPPPKPAGSPRPEQHSEKNGRSVYELRPMWHTEVPQFFEPVAGLHFFAVIHPYTLQTVCVQVGLPPGRPRLEIDRNDIEFDYGRYDVEIHFKRNGGVAVKQ